MSRGPRPTYHQANAPSVMPVTQAQGHHERSPVCSAGTSSVTTRATAHTAVPTSDGTSSGSVGAR